MIGLRAATVTLLSGRKGCGVRIEQARGAEIGTLLRGKTPEDAACLIPLIFNLCAAAQGAACRAALGLPQLPDTARRIAEEALRETAFVVAKAWPEAMGLAPEPGLLSDLSVFAGCKRLLLRADVLIARAPIAARPAMKTVRAQVLRQIGSLTDAAPQPPIAFGTGWGQARAARGAVTHRVRVADGKITHYAVETPTDRMLGRGDAVERALGALRSSGPRLEVEAKLILASLNPCVPVTLHVEEPAYA